MEYEEENYKSENCEKYQELKFYKEIYDIEEYLKEMQENENIINNYDRDRAVKQNQKLTTKYMLELNMIATLTKNNNYVVQVDYRIITDEKIRNDLKYLNNLIPLIALSRMGISKIEDNILNNMGDKE
jgi:hypothetical protein